MDITNNVVTDENGTVVYWTLIDGEWTYMDIYTYTTVEWDNTTPADLENRQVTQYTAWREYCENPIINTPTITSTTIGKSV
jgi:hypothetical protein